jgi:hypothetical protein
VPEPSAVLGALLAAAGLAAGGVLLAGLPWRAPRPAPASAGWVLGVGAGLLLGCWLLGQWPRWPPREDQDRFLLLVLPAAALAELVAGFPAVPRRLAWGLRLAVAAGAGGVLLHHTVYLDDLAGPGSREWTPAQGWLVLGALAAALAGSWALLGALADRAPGRWAPLVLAVSCAGAGVAVMSSGYATGGLLGLLLAAAFAGAAAGSLVPAGPPRVRGALGLGVVALFGLLVLGRFFGELSTTRAAVLFGAPLLCWLPELPPVRRLKPWQRGLVRVALVIVPVAAVVAQARETSPDRSAPPAGASEPSIQDYRDYGR